MTTPNRKRIRLVEKLKELDSVLLVIKAAPQGSANILHPKWDKDAMYVSRRTLIELLENNWVPGGPLDPLSQDLADDLAYDRAAQAADCTHKPGSDGFCKKCHVALKA